MHACMHRYYGEEGGSISTSAAQLTLVETKSLDKAYAVSDIRWQGMRRMEVVRNLGLRTWRPRGGGFGIHMLNGSVEM